MLEVGTKAPNFSLKDKDGNVVSLSDFAGKKVVVYFYPKDNTPGCTLEAQSFRDSFEEYTKQGITVIGISKDSEESHEKFVNKQNLPFILLSDPEADALQKYEAWGEKSMFGKKYMGILRITYVIDESGNIEKAYEKVKVKTHGLDVLKDLLGK